MKHSRTSNNARHGPYETAIRVSLGLLVVTFGVIAPRLMVVGLLPANDDGFYTFFTQLIYTSLAHGQGLPPTAGLSLYTTLASPVMALGGNPFILTRALDLVVAALAGWLCYRILVQEAGSALAGAVIALVFLLAMNHPVFIQSGFRNSFFAAYVPLFLAVRVWQTAAPDASTQWFVIGGLVALAVLLRETFLHFALVAGCAILFRHGLVATRRFVLGGMLVGAIIILAVATARSDGLTGVIDGYRGGADLYEAVDERRWTLFLMGGLQFAQYARVALAVAGLLLALWWWQSRRLREAGHSNRMWFWLAVALVPLAEPAMKIGVQYHFAAVLPGLAGASALAWRTLVSPLSPGRRTLIASVLGLVLAPLLYHEFGPLRWSWPKSLATLTHFSEGGWPPELRDQSNYLIAAAAIRQLAPAGGTLSTTAWMHGLFPLTGLYPPTPDLANLTLAFLQLGHDGAALQERLARCPPDVVMVAARTDYPGRDAIEAAVNNTGLYRLAATVAVRTGIEYGRLGGNIYVKRRPDPHPCLPAHQSGGERPVP